jgi:hypothetical protein
MDISTSKHEIHRGVPRDPEYKKLIDNLKYQIRNYQGGQKGGQIRTLKIGCQRQFETFNNVEHVNEYHSLYELCPINLQRHAEQRAYVPGGNRDCFRNTDGLLTMIVFHVRKAEFDTKVFYGIARRLRIEVNYISSFKNPRQFIGACFSRSKGEQRKIQITPKASGIMKKLLNVLSSVSIVDILSTDIL